MARRRALAGAGWLVVVPLLLVAGARIAAWDARSLLVAANALTLFLYLPAWPVAVAAGLGRRWALFGTALLVVVAHICFLAPELSARSPVPPVVAGARAVRLFTANVYAGNPEPAGIAQEIRDARPDVVYLQEATPAIVEAVDAAGALDELPYRMTVGRNDPLGALVAARWPLLDQDVVEVDGRPVLLRATVEPEGDPVRLYAVHVVAPFGGGRQPWVDQLGRVTMAVRSERLPVLMAGDFNATWSHRVSAGSSKPASPTPPPPGAAPSR